MPLKVKVLSRNPADYLRETKDDIFKVPRNYSREAHPFQECREYVRALNSTKLERVFAKPFVASLDGHSDGVSCLAKHPRLLSLLISGSYDGQLRLWDLTRRCSLAQAQAHTGFVRGIAVDSCSEAGGAGSSFVTTVGDDQLIKRWSINEEAESASASADIDLGEPVHSIICKSQMQDVSHHWKKSQFATCGEGVDIWDHHRNSPVRSFEWGADSLTKLAYNPIETDLLASCSLDRGIYLYDCREKNPLRKVTLKLRSNAVCWNPMEAYVFTVANEDYNLYTFDVRHLSSAVNCHMDHTEAVMCVDYAPTGREIVSGSYDKSIRIFPLSKGRSREVYHTKRMHRVMAVAWSMDNKFILSGSDEMNIRIWKANASEKLGTLRPREQQAAAYAEKLKEKFANHPEVRRISRHRNVPKHIYNARKEHATIRASQKRKEANRRIHSSSSAKRTSPWPAERTKHVVGEDH